MMIKRYKKGARSERELLTALHKHNYSVMRSAGSGINSISPDVIAFKNKKGLAFECKAWKGTSISISFDKWKLLAEWERNTGMATFIAWRLDGEGWFFARLNELSKARANYTLTKSRAFKINRRLKDLLKSQF